jgi:hypothetical protein
MAALTLATGILTTAARADDSSGTVTPPVPATPPASTARTPGTVYKVQLALRVAGLTARGCDVEVKPAHPGCSFKTIVEHIGPNGLANLRLDDVRTVSADRDCTFAITIREAGQTARTVYRGMRLSPSHNGRGPLFLECILNSPSRIARMNAAEGETRTR